MQTGHNDLVRVQPAEAGSDPTEQPLFRVEAIAARRTQWLGPVILARPLSQTLYALVACAAACMVVAFLVFGQFTRKATVKGWLIPEEGLIKVFAPQPGLISQVRTHEGATVKRGDVLMVVSAERQSAAGGTAAAVGRLLDERRSSLSAEEAQTSQLFQQQRAAGAVRLEALRAEAAQVQREIGDQKERVELLARLVERQRELQQQGFVSMQQEQQQEEQLLEQRGKLRGLERDHIVALREISMAEADIRDAPIKARSQIEALHRTITELDQERVEAEARREIIIPAPHDGVVTAILAEAGSTASPNTPLLSIVPEGAVLEAQLFSPTRAIGFVRRGQRVLLRYEAYPYQKFGHYLGTVKTVSRSAITPAELPGQFAALSSLASANEPMYRIVVQLERQSVTAYGRPQALSPGMLLEADVITDRRRLYEWLLDPLYTLTGRL
jgi:membrane fusion protein